MTNILSQKSTYAHNHSAWCHVLSQRKKEIHQQKKPTKPEVSEAEPFSGVVEFLKCMCPPCSDPYADPYYDYEMEALWRGGQYENFRVQYTEAPLPYHYSVSILLNVEGFFFLKSTTQSVAKIIQI